MQGWLRLACKASGQNKCALCGLAICLADVLFALADSRADRTRNAMITPKEGKCFLHINTLKRSSTLQSANTFHVI